MEQLIDFHAPEVQAVLDTLLKDKSTGKNIIWATDPPEELQTVMYEPVTDRSQITTQQLRLTHYEVVLPRMMKQTDTQQQRTRKKGEVFSPAWVCNKMNNALDADWFGALGAGETAGQFTVELPQGWQTVETPVQFPVCKGRTPAWVQYVQSRRLEVTCGEAPFLASRYDAATGEMIPVARRIGILDRKLRVVSENAATEDEWRKYATHAVQSTYGYEYQGDNLLLARVNLLLTYAEHLQARWQRKPTKEELQPIATIISWNLWQMDGLHLSVPGGKPQPEAEQLDLFSMFGAAEPQLPTVSCKVKNWRKGSHGTAQNFETIQEGSTSMKFDYVIGNPPYQDETLGDKYIREDYVNNVSNLHSYKVFLPGATGTGQFGETIAAPFIGLPGDGSTETFMGIGQFEKKEEADNAVKYIKTKFARAMYGILKRTQANTPGKWQWVPLQDFTAHSDIDWSKSVAEIDRQLYRKYDLTADEIEFIETHVKEMA